PPAASPAARGAPAPAAAPAAAHAPGGGPGAAVALPAGLATQLEQLGLTADQVRGVLALSREVVEKVVWEVVPVLAETLIKEEIERLTAE
ncbi:MAG TPA: response regulator, partial [Polyangiaceae bacterium]|nr:response regulator [Polyangiaceae bacterium]